MTDIMVRPDLPPALHSKWALYVLRNQVHDIGGTDVERRWADDLITLGFTSDAVVALAILNDAEWEQAPALVDTILREMLVDPADKPNLLWLMRDNIALAITNGADPRAASHAAMLLASECCDLPGYDGALDVFYGIDDAFDIEAAGLEVTGVEIDPELAQLGARNWALKQLREEE